MLEISYSPFCASIRPYHDHVSTVTTFDFPWPEKLFSLVPDLIFIWSPLTTLEPFFSKNPKKMQIEATEVF